MTQEEVARGGASGGAAAHDRRRWLSVQDILLETMDPEEHYQQGVHIIERIYGRQDIGKRVTVMSV